MADALSSGGSDLWSCGFKSRQPHHVFLMDETLIEAVKQWNIDASLPLQVGDFTLIFSFEPAGKGEETVFAYKDEKKGGPFALYTMTVPVIFPYALTSACWNFRSSSLLRTTSMPFAA